MRSGFHPQSIRTLLVLFALALTAPLLGLSVYALNRMAEAEQRMIEGRVAQVAKALGEELDREFERAFITLETLSTSDALRRDDLSAFHAQAKLALKPAKAAIVLIDRTYQQVVDTLKEFGAELPPTADPETAQRVIDTKTRHVSGVFKGSISGRPVFNVEVPVFDRSGEVRHVLIMSFQAAHIADLLTGSYPGSPWITGMTDSRGVIVARSERHDEFVGQQLPAELFEQSKSGLGGVYRATNVAGVPILRSTVRSVHSDWYVSATVPLAHVDAPRIRTYWFAALLFAAAIVLSGTLAYLFGTVMAGSLQQAARLASSVGSGEVVAASHSPLAEANVLMQTLAGASSELKRRQEHSEFLMRELAHRAKNQLAVVRGMAMQTARQSANVEEFTTHFSRRLQGLSQSQDLLLAQEWRGAWLSDLVHAHLELFAAGDQLEISGPPMFLEARAVQNLGFALHELATNAAKYGALSVTGGGVRVDWTDVVDGVVRLSWAEHGGPPAGPPPRRGFGFRVIMELVPRALEASAACDFTPEGLLWRLDFPASLISTAATDHGRSND